MNRQSKLWNVVGWVFGAMVFAVGLVNTFWGNDPDFGIFVILISFVYLPPVNRMFTSLTKFSIPGWAKVALGLFIFWAALGVGELFDKIDLMVNDLF